MSAILAKRLYSHFYLLDYLFASWIIEGMIIIILNDLNETVWYNV